jgi:hypothetical protein
MAIMLHLSSYTYSDEVAVGEWQLGGLIEVDASVYHPENGSSSTDLTLSTVELNAAVALSRQLSAAASTLYEQHATSLEIDTAHLQYQFIPQDISLFAGQLYLPFGHYQTALVSDPLNLELGESRQTTLLLEYNQQRFSSAAYWFNGDIHQQHRSLKDHWGLHLAYSGDKYAVGLDYISSLDNSAGLQDSFAGNTIDQHIAGLSANIRVTMANFTLLAEQTQALDTINTVLVNGAKPQARNLEINYTFVLAGKSAVLAAAHQTTDQSVDFSLPEQKTLLGLSLVLTHALSVAIEFSTTRDYSAAQGGSGEEADTFILHTDFIF